MRGRDTSYTGALDGRSQKTEERREKPDKSGCLAIPSIDEVRDFGKAQGISDDVSEKFFNLNAGRGWRIDGKPIHDWRKLLCSWSTYERQREPAPSVETNPGFEKVVIEGVEQWRRKR